MKGIIVTEKREAVVLSAVRTAVGKFGGALKDIPPSELAATVTREAVRRSGLAPGDIAAVVFGNVIHTDAKDMYLARVAALRGPAGRDLGAHPQPPLRQRPVGDPCCGAGDCSW